MMRQWVLIVVTLILVALTGRIMSEVDVDDGEPVNKDHFYIEVLHRALAESDKLNLTMAMAAATRFSNGSAHLQRLLLDRNIIHHTLDLYRLSQNNAERAYLVEILGILVEKGAAIREQDDEEPDVVTKSVFIREMVLANKLVHAGQLPLSLSSSLLRLLYMIPCDAVPLAKLLLHAHTIVLNVITAKGEFPDGVEGIKKFVNSAALQPGAKPAVKGSDLAAMSPTYSALLSRLGTQEQHDRGIYLSDIIDVLDETTSRLHDAFVSTPSVSKATTSSDSAGEAGDPRQVTVEMLSQTDNFGRNPLHILCLSGAKKLLTALLDHVGSLSSPASTSVTKALVKALTAKDARGQTPMTYLVARFGARSDRHPSRSDDHLSSNSLQQQQQQQDQLLYSDRAALIDGLTTLFASVGEPLEIGQARVIPDTDHKTKSTDIKSKNTDSNTLANLEVGGWNQSTVHESIRGDADRCDVVELFASDYLDRAQSSDEYATAGFAGFSGKRFLEEFVNTGTPVILRGAALRSPIRETLSFPVLTAKHGKEPMYLSTLPYAGSFGVPGFRATLADVAALAAPVTVTLSADEVVQHLTLLREAAAAQLSNLANNTTSSTTTKSASATVGIDGETTTNPTSSVSTPAVKVKPIVEDPPLYAFTTLSPALRASLNTGAPLPPCLAELLMMHTQNTRENESGHSDTPTPSSSSSSQQQQVLKEVLKSTDYFAANVETQFYLGPEGSGAPVHFHTHAMNTLAYGEKRWLLFPPSESFYSTRPALEFVRKDPRATTALQCTQRPGDILYVPSLWGHATVNTKQSVGVAHEFTLEGTCFV